MEKASTTFFSEIFVFFATVTTIWLVASSGIGVERSLLRSVSSVRLVSELPSLDSLDSTTTASCCIPCLGFLFLFLGGTSTGPALVVASVADRSLSRTEEFLVDLLSIFRRNYLLHVPFAPFINFRSVCTRMYSVVFSLRPLPHWGPVCPS